MTYKSTTKTLGYGRKLINAGISGVRAGRQNLDPEVASKLVTISAEESLKMAFLGACLGIVPALTLRRRSRLVDSFMFGALGGVVGFCAAFSWKTRTLTSSLAHGAIHEVQRVKDEHWLEVNPIDYA